MTLAEYAKFRKKEEEERMIQEVSVGILEEWQDLIWREDRKFLEEQLQKVKEIDEEFWVRQVEDGWKDEADWQDEDEQWAWDDVNGVKFHSRVR